MRWAQAWKWNIFSTSKFLLTICPKGHNKSENINSTRGLVWPVVMVKNKKKHSIKCYLTCAKNIFSIPKTLGEIFWPTRKKWNIFEVVHLIKSNVKLRQHFRIWVHALSWSVQRLKIEGVLSCDVFHEHGEIWRDWCISNYKLHVFGSAVPAECSVQDG